MVIRNCTARFSLFLKSRKFSEMSKKGVIIINLISTVNNPSLFRL